jgi:hypothetical protein
MIRAATRTDMIKREIRVAGFEILKQKSNSAMKTQKKIPILPRRRGFMNVNRGGKLR